ncbi:MAG TPA: phosphoribosylformylglycinamidine cyclo-ligase [Pyrinomonadaceae bacterium]|nr:phosphoribosylformylglycinamidine cyclo-ligase [Pyrinomonadaceae bacterium]
MSRSITYSDAGVSIDAANAAVERIKKLARGTFNARTLSEIGSFGGMFDGAFPGMQSPVLVASADGVGTKLKIAFMTGVHDTVGRDLVNHCTNDILVQGARPLFFLDYVATGVLAPEVIVAVVAGVARGCGENGCVLLGGETAEMPGFYPEGEYDVAGFIVGVVERGRAIDGSRVAAGDVLLALPSAGLHTNGYSLARKLFFEVAGYKAETRLDALGMTVGEALLQPHLSYLRPLEGLLDTGQIRALAHITGGGLVENIPRVLPEGTAVEIERGSWPVLPVFKLMREIGNVAEAEMLRTFNMGVGMVVICAASDAETIEKHLAALGEKCYRIGRVVGGNREVTIV